MKATSAKLVRAFGCLSVTLRAIAMLLLVTLPQLGCQNNGSQRDAYIRDLRMHEDQIYELQDYMTEYQQLLCEQRKENARLRQQLSEQLENEAEDVETEEELLERSLLDRPRTIREETMELPDTELPNIELGEPAIPDVDLGAPTTPDGELGEFEELPPGEADEFSRSVSRGSARLASAQYELPPLPALPADSCALYAEQLPTEPGTDLETTGRGVMALVEPLTSDGGAGAFAGEVSLMLVDPEASDEQWEIARWNFTAEEVEDSWRDESRHVLDLPIAVPATAPLDRPLELWVRLVPTGEDRKMLCSTALTLTAQVTATNSLEVSDQSVIERVTTDWAAANQLDVPTGEPLPHRPAKWTAASQPVPVETARSVPNSRPTTKQASGTPAWSPKRR